ncbi:Coiled-coil domain-containing protein 42 [Bagarius yarrelli]|uniref:Coiled-coil domain-containing protein 42 n=1 Tax=Bagarius yarrelli TaxID=175774 RepID=A0A556U0E7_BAGYA|nr:Coiled-coil domain-containing protein 42 [Bagarius yarrelli]
MRIDALKMEQELNPLINRNQKQRAEAEKKARANKKLTEERKDFIEKSYKEINTLNVERQHLNKKTEKECIHPRYMDAVVKNSKHFHDPHELLTHFNTRKLVQEELKLCIEKKKMDLAEYCANLSRVREEYFLNRETQMAKLSWLKYKLLKTKESVRDWDREWQDVQWIEKMKNCREHEINMATANISRHLWKMGIEIPKPTRPDETIDVLDMVIQTVFTTKQASD